MNKFLFALIILAGIVFYFIGRNDGEEYIPPQDTTKVDSLATQLHSKQLSIDSLHIALSDKLKALDSLRLVKPIYIYKDYEKLSTDSIDVLFVERYNSAIRNREKGNGFKHIRPARVSYERSN